MDVDKEQLLYNLLFISQEDWGEVLYLLTDPNSYGIMNDSSIYLFSGILLSFIVGAIGYFRTLNQSPVKIVYRRRWVRD